MIPETLHRGVKQSSDDSRVILRTGAPHRRVMKYARDLMHVKSWLSGRIETEERLLYVTSFKAARRRPVGGKGELPTRGGDPRPSVGGSCGGGGFLPANGANSALDTCHINVKKLSEPQSPYGRRAINRWHNRGYTLDGDTFVRDDFDSADENIHSIRPADYPRILNQNTGLCEPPQRGGLSYELTIYENTIQIKRTFKLPERPTGGGTRGAITRFSDQSRKRMITKFSNLNDPRIAVFGTFTYADDCLPDKEKLHADMRKFERFILNINPNAGISWHTEIQDRKTGQFVGREVPHFHCIIWGLLGYEREKHGRRQSLSLPFIQRLLIAKWIEITGTAKTKDAWKANKVLLAVNPQHVQRYVSKYVAKADEKDFGDWGRRWGFAGQISFSEIVQKDTIDFFEFTLFKAAVVDWLRSSGHKGKGRYADIIEQNSENGFTVFNLGADTIQNQRRVLPLLRLQAMESRWFWEN